MAVRVESVPLARAAAEPETTSLIGLADRFVETHETMANRAFCFILGAGASKSSKIKTAGEMVADWIKLLYRAATGDPDGDGQAWASSASLRIPKHDSADLAASYSQLYQRMYASDPDRGYAYSPNELFPALRKYALTPARPITYEDLRNRLKISRVL